MNILLFFYKKQNLQLNFFFYIGCVSELMPLTSMVRTINKTSLLKKFFLSLLSMVFAEQSIGKIP